MAADRRSPNGSSSRSRHAAASLAFVVALAPAVAGAVVLLHERSERIVRDPIVAGLALHLESATWVHDSMQHVGGGGYAMPAAMTPGMPPAGQGRLSVEVSVRNTARDVQFFRVDELELRSPDDRWPPISAEVTEVGLAPGEAVNSLVEFDVPEKVSSVRLVWTRAGANVSLLSTRPEEHAPDAGPGPAERWPKDASLLPPGSAATGERLFATSYGCVPCHGDARVPGTNLVGPPLGSLGAVAASRVPGKSAAQYVYESILFPNAYVVHECARGATCANPSVMPSYAEVLSLQEMADLVAYLSAVN